MFFTFIDLASEASHSASQHKNKEKKFCGQIFHTFLCPINVTLLYAFFCKMTTLDILLYIHPAYSRKLHEEKKGTSIVAMLNKIIMVEWIDVLFFCSCYLLKEKKRTSKKMKSEWERSKCGTPINHKNMIISFLSWFYFFLLLLQFQSISYILQASLTIALWRRSFSHFCCSL